MALIIDLAGKNIAFSPAHYRDKRHENHSIAHPALISNLTPIPLENYQVRSYTIPPTVLTVNRLSNFKTIS